MLAPKYHFLEQFNNKKHVNTLWLAGFVVVVSCLHGGSTTGAASSRKKATGLERTQGLCAFQGCSKISLRGILSRLELLFSTVYGSKSSKSAWLQTNHVKSQLCTGKASSLQERFQMADYNNMKGKYCYLLNAGNRLSLQMSL